MMLWGPTTIMFSLLIPRTCRAFTAEVSRIRLGHRLLTASFATRVDARTTSISDHHVILKRTRQSRAFREGNPLVFSGAIAYTTSETPIDMADFVQVSVESDKSQGAKTSKAKEYKNLAAPKPDSPLQLIGWGVYNPESMYRVRILCHATTNVPLANKVKECVTSEQALSIIMVDRFQNAIAVRQALGLPSALTDTYRLVNGEGDGVSGLAVDIIGGKVAVVMASAAWCELWKDHIIDSLKSAFLRHAVYRDSPLDIVWKTTPARLAQDGLKLDAIEYNQEEKPDDRPIISSESGIKYTTYPYDKGQKTGFYCDQRENKYQMAQLCEGKRVLDLCCYHGGFALTAKIIGKATTCVGVDSSQDAIDICRTNEALNGISEGIEFVRADISQFMRDANSAGTTFDVIILDPPKLAPSVNDLDRAVRKYHSLNRDALKLFPPNGGLFMSCTCSAAMTQKDGGQLFLQTVQQAALSAGRQVTLLRESGAAACHTLSPASFPAGAYLTAALFHVSAIDE